MKAKVEAEIDELYKLSLTDFTKARNTLAKTLEGAERKAVAALPKPSLPAWVVNQLHWHDASTYRALVDASEKLRAAHRAALSGRNTDTRKPDELHRTTIEKAMARALALADKRGVTVSDAARDALRRTLSALPVDDEPAGRITHEPPPAGFSLLTGVKPAATKRESKPDQKLTREAAAIQKAAERRAEEQRKEELRKAHEQQIRERKEKENREREIRKAEQALKDAERRLAELKG